MTSLKENIPVDGNTANIPHALTASQRNSGMLNENKQKRISSVTGCNQLSCLVAGATKPCP